MDRQRFLILLLVLCLPALWGCAGGGAAPAAPPALEMPVYYYVGVNELNLKSLPDPSSSNTALVRLNERVEMVQRRGSWFLVKTAAGAQGWAIEKDLELKPVTSLYVRRWGVRLRAAPEDRGKTVERLRLNDQVKILEQNNQGWVRVTVARTRASGWLELSELSVNRVIVRRPVRKAAPVPPAGATPAPAPPVMLSPAPAVAAPPPPGEAAPQKTAPPETAPPETSPSPAPRKAKPEMFEPF